MTDTRVTNILLNGAFQPVVDAYVEIALLAPTDSSPAWGSGGNYQIISRAVVRTNNDGMWELPLAANNLITPAGTVYRVTQRILGTANQVSYFSVPDDGGTHNLFDLLVSSPDNIPAQASQVAFAPADGMTSTNVEDAILEAFTNGGGGGSAAYQTSDFSDLTTIATQGSNSLTATGVVSAAITNTNNGSFKVINVDSAFSVVGTGEPNQAITIHILTLLEQLTSLSAGWDIPEGVKAWWQGQIAGIEARGLLMTPGSFGGASQVLLCDMLGMPLKDTMTDGDNVYFNATWLVSAD